MELTVAIMFDHIKAGFSKWGIEGIEQKIKEIYGNHPDILEKYLGVYNTILKGE
jgi:hypothetical protein